MVHPSRIGRAWSRRPSNTGHLHPTSCDDGAGGGPPPGAPSIAPIVVNSAQVGHVAVPSGPPPMEVALRELGPTLTWSGLALLGIGSMTVALLIFRPARKRLRSLEAAALRPGTGSDRRAGR